MSDNDILGQSRDGNSGRLGICSRSGSRPFFGGADVQASLDKKLLRAITPQLVLIGLILTLEICSRVGLLPSPSDLSHRLTELFLRYGLPLVAISSFLENSAGVGTYFPGSIALITAMTLTAGDPHRALLTYIAVVVPAVAANLFSYWVGHLTRRKSTPAKRSPRSLVFWYATTYWHPQLAGITAMASGAEGVPFLSYAASFLPISIGWSLAWAILLYNAGRAINVPQAFAPALYVYLVGWLLWDVRKYLRRS